MDDLEPTYTSLGTSTEASRPQELPMQAAKRA